MSSFLEQETILLLTGLLTCGGYVVVIVGIAAAAWFVARKSGSKRELGDRAFEAGRLFEALKHYELCENKLVLTARANLWLWRLTDATVALDLALNMNLEGQNVDTEATPLMSLATALRGDRDAGAWRGTWAPEGILAQAVALLRVQRWAEAVSTLAGIKGLQGVRAQAFKEALLVWAQTEVDGTPRPIDAAAVLGEGAINELEAGWPAFAKLLRQGRAERQAG